MDATTNKEENKQVKDARKQEKPLSDELMVPSE
jgi:hypothetical protein